MKKPRILVTRQALNCMVDEVLTHPDIETAWGLFGLIGEEATIVTDVLRPSTTDVVRHYATTQLGGERQAEAVRWMHANYRLTQKLGIQPTTYRAAFLFKGHSHHQLGVGSYSYTDRRSILEVVQKDGLEVAVGPLATLTTNESVRPASAGTLVVTQNQRVWLKFYYYSRKMLEAKYKEPIVVLPEVVDAAHVYKLPPFGWQFTHDDDFQEQLRHFHSYGCEVQVFTREVHNGPPFEIQFLVKKPTWKGTLSIVTDWDYPRHAPTFQVLTDPTITVESYENYPGADYLLQGSLWEPGMDLIEAIFRLEARGEL